MWKTVSLCLLVCTAILSTTVLSGRTGKFQITDDGVKGEGSYSLNNQTAEINLHLLIGNILNGIAGQPMNVPILKPTLKDQAGKNKQPEINQTSSQPDGVRPANKESHRQEPTKVVKPEQDELSNDDVNFAMDGLTEHNRFRTVHGSTVLKLDRAMSLQAQTFARQLAKLGTLKHSARDTRPGQGENLAMGCSSGDSTMTAAAATKKWYDEVCNYDFSNSTFQKPCGHFSQIIWKSTGSVGIGKAYGTKWGMNCTFIVARYGPQGNIANLIKDNVQKGTFDLSYCNTVTRTLDKDQYNPRRPQEDEYQAADYYNPDQYGLNEGFLNDEGEGMKSIGFREKIPRVRPMKIQVL